MLLVLGGDMILPVLFLSDGKPLSYMEILHSRVSIVGATAIIEGYIWSQGWSPPNYIER